MHESTNEPSPSGQPAAVTVLGLGPMGVALAGALLERGHPTTVWNRTASKADPLVARGAQRAATVAEAVSASPLTIVCVIDYDAMVTLKGKSYRLRERGTDSSPRPKPSRQVPSTQL